MLRQCELLYIDVQVCRPTAPSLVPLSSLAIQNIPLQSTLHSEATKTKRYQEIAKLNSYDFFPFVMETFGGFGLQAQKLLKKITTHAADSSPLQLLQHIKKRLSVTLHIGNANVLLHSMQRFHLKQYDQLAAEHQSANRGRRYYYCVRKPSTMPKIIINPLNSNVLQQQLDKLIIDKPLALSTRECTFDPGLDTIKINFGNNIDTADITQSQSFTDPYLDINSSTAFNYPNTIT